MKTAKRIPKLTQTERFAQWKELDSLASNGRLVTWQDIKQWRLLFREFAKKRPKASLKSKVVDNQAILN